MRYPFDTHLSDITTGPLMNYSQIKSAIAHCRPFTHSRNSMSGGWNETGDTYYVFSYRTCIAWVNVYGERWLNPQRYSVTTSKQQGYTATYLPTTAADRG